MSFLRWPTKSYMVGVYNVWSVPVERAVQDNALTTQHGLYFHATDWDIVVQILKRGLKAMNRNEIHSPPDHD